MLETLDVNLDGLKLKYYQRIFEKPPFCILSGLTLHSYAETIDSCSSGISYNDCERFGYTIFVHLFLF